MKCCNISAGLLREPVRFERATRVASGGGGHTQTWAEIANAPKLAFVTPTGGREWVAHDRVEAIPRLKVVTRYSAEIVEGDRIIIRDKAHDIIRLDNVEFRNKWLEMHVDGGTAT